MKGFAGRESMGEKSSVQLRQRTVFSLKNGNVQVLLRLIGGMRDSGGRWQGHCHNRKVERSEEDSIEFILKQGRGAAMSYIEFQHVTKKYEAGENPILAVDDASFFVEKGELAIILGASGAGKTTALNILGGMDVATSGMVRVDGKDITGCSREELAAYRRSDIGFVFQFYNLVPNLTALENVELAAQICSHPLDASETLYKVGLEGRKDNFPAQLSGGEQQRVSIARALAKNPKLLLCDEPTGALDYATGRQILQLLQDMCRRDGITIVLITHNSALAPMADRLIRFRSGKVVEMTENAEPAPISEIEW